MFFIRKQNSEWLFNNLKVFSSVPFEKKKDILYLSIKNLESITVTEDDKKIHKKIIESIKKGKKNNNFVRDIINELGTKENISIFLKKYRKLDSMKKLEKFYEEGYMLIPAVSCYVVSSLFNLLLYISDLCLLVLYAFGAKQLNPIKNKLSEVIELSLFYFYRLIDLNYDGYYLDNEDNTIEYAGTTSYFFIKDKKIYKYPKNLASRLYIIKQEYEHAIYLKKTSMKEFVVDHYSLDEERAILGHKFEEGNNGEYYLFNKKISQEQIDSLRNFYENYITRTNKDIILDIHPGNFIWDNLKNKWYLIDVGPIPYIGREYYEYSFFEEYFNHIWIRRLERMEKYPIRSINLDTNK